MDLNKQPVIAAEDGDEKIVIEMLSKGANPDAMGPNSGALPTKTLFCRYGETPD